MNGQVFKLKYDFSSQSDEELSVQKGTIVVGLSEPANDWILVAREDDPSKRGFVPLNYVQKVDPPAPVTNNDDLFASSAFPTPAVSNDLFSQPNSNTPSQFTNNMFPDPNTMTNPPLFNSNNTNDMFNPSPHLDTNMFPPQPTAFPSNDMFNTPSAPFQQQPAFSNDMFNSQGQAAPFANPSAQTQNFFGSNVSNPSPNFNSNNNFSFPNNNAQTFAPPVPRGPAIVSLSDAFQPTPPPIAYPQMPPPIKAAFNEPYEDKYKELMKSFDKLNEITNSLNASMENLALAKAKNVMLVNNCRRTNHLLEIKRLDLENQFRSVNHIITQYNPQPPPPGYVKKIPEPEPIPVVAEVKPPVINNFTEVKPPSNDIMQQAPPTIDTNIPKPTFDNLNKSSSPLGSPIALKSSFPDVDTSGMDAEPKQSMKQLEIIANKILEIRTKYEVLALTPTREAKDVKAVEDARKIYDELLLQQMMKADCVDSYGNEFVRNCRKSLLRDVQALHDALDKIQHSEMGSHKTHSNSAASNSESNKPHDDTPKETHNNYEEVPPSSPKPPPPKSAADGTK